MFTSAGFGISDSLFNIVITGVVNLIFTIVAMRTVNDWGRRKLMLTGAMGFGITYILLRTGYYLSLPGSIVVVMVLTAIAIYAMSLAPITWVVLSEIFPNRARGPAMAFATTVLWIASTLLVVLFPFINSFINVSGAFWLYAVICFLGYTYIKLKLLETKNKSLEEVETDLIK